MFLPGTFYVHLCIKYHTLLPCCWSQYHFLSEKPAWKITLVNSLLSLISTFINLVIFEVLTVKSQDYGLPRSYAAYFECFIAIFRVEYGDINFVYSGTAGQVYQTTRRQITRDCTSHRSCCKATKIRFTSTSTSNCNFKLSASASIPTGQTTILPYTEAILL
jgi:hypothetical protein